MENETKIYSNISLPVFDENNHKLGNLQFLSEDEWNAYRKIVRKTENEKFVYDQRLANKFILDLHENGIEFTEEMELMLTKNGENEKEKTNEEFVKNIKAEPEEENAAETDIAVTQKEEEIEESAEAETISPKSGITEIPLTQLEDFPDHPFLVQDDEDMKELAEDIKLHGVLVPALVRQKDNEEFFGKIYQIISGHRRKRACELAGLETLKCEIAELTDDEAVIAMINSNLIQRKKYKPSEKAFAYKMKLEAMKRQGQRENSTSAQLGQKLRDEQINIDTPMEKVYNKIKKTL